MILPCSHDFDHALDTRDRSPAAGGRLSQSMQAYAGAFTGQKDLRLRRLTEPRGGEGARGGQLPSFLNVGRYYLDRKFA